MDSLETIGWWWVGVVGTFFVALVITLWIIIRAVIDQVSVKESAERFWRRWRSGRP
ncbi:hypothetical protein HY346_03170 [Candidatus Microgenomates bacterium]|nr:hypothetical protein [Candidatus Microgenomates bacterium]